MINLSLIELKPIAKTWGIKDYKSKSEDDLIKVLSEPKTNISFSKKRIKDIKEKFNESRYKFSRSKIKEIRRSLYDINKSKKSSQIKNKRYWKKS